MPARTLLRWLQITSLGVDKLGTMIENLMSESTVDDPRKLSELLARITELAQAHNVSSVVVGITSEVGDRLFPEFVEFLRSALRVEDGIYRMTRERAVVHLADLDLDGGQTVFGRLLEDFIQEFPMAKELKFDTNFSLAKAGSETLENKQILAEIFPRRMLH